MCPYPHGPIKETTPGDKVLLFQMGKLRHGGTDIDVKGCKQPTSSSLGGFADGLVMLGSLYNWRKPGEVRLTPRSHLHASRGVFFLSSPLCFPLLPGKGFAESFAFPKRHISRSSCISVTGLCMSRLQEIGLVVISVPVRMNER